MSENASREVMMQMIRDSMEKQIDAGNWPAVRQIRQWLDLAASVGDPLDLDVPPPELLQP